MDNAGKYRELREMHKEFIYHGYDIADDGIFFHFSICLLYTSDAADE